MQAAEFGQRSIARATGALSRRYSQLVSPWLERRRDGPGVDGSIVPGITAGPQTAE